MKLSFVVVLMLTFVLSAKAEDQLLRISALITAYGKYYTIPPVVTQSGKKVTSTRETDAGNIVVTTEATIVEDIVNYSITASIPSEDGSSKSEIAVEGKADIGKQVIREVESGGNVYGVNLVFDRTTDAETEQ